MRRTGLLLAAAAVLVTGLSSAPAGAYDGWYGNGGYGSQDDGRRERGWGWRALREALLVQPNRLPPLHGVRQLVKPTAHQRHTSLGYLLRGILYGNMDASTLMLKRVPKVKI